MKKRKMNVLCIAMALYGMLVVTTSSAQHPCQDDVYQNSLWSSPALQLQFSEQGDVDDILLPIPPDASPGDDYMGELATNAHNAYHDQNGDLKFFMVDQGLYDRDGYMIDKMISDDGAIKGSSELCIVPDPADCERYYIFASHYGEPPFGGQMHGPFYSLLDISAPNINYAGKEGAIISSSTGGENAINVFDVGGFEDADGFPIGSDTDHDAYHFAASPLSDDGTFRLIFMAEGPTIYRMRLDANGITPINPPIILNDDLELGEFNWIPASAQFRSELEMVRLNGTTWRVALGLPNGIAKFDVDLNGDYVSGSGFGYELTESTSALPYVKGLEFSASGDYLYFTHHITPDNPDAVKYLDFATMTVSTLNVSPLNQSDFTYSQIELGANGKMYFAYSGGLAALVDPENPATSTWEPTSVPFSNSLSDAGFPTQDKQRVYLLPDQIDGMNYYDHFLVY